MTDRTASLRVTWEPNLDTAAAVLTPEVASVGSPPITLVPSMLTSSHPVVSGLRSVLRASGVRTRAVVPRALVPAAIGRRGGDVWQPIEAGARTFHIDARLANQYVAVVLIDEQHRAGPFVLDLPSRFLHPIDRVRLAAMPDRLRLLADLAAPVPPALSVLLTQVDGGWLSVVTSDAVAAELWALGLAERFLDTRLEMQGPWEDPTVQRATELEMGIRVPLEMVLEVDTDRRIEPAARELLGRTATRLGMTIRDA